MQVLAYNVSLCDGTKSGCFPAQVLLHLWDTPFLGFCVAFRDTACHKGVCPSEGIAPENFEELLRSDELRIEGLCTIFPACLVCQTGILEWFYSLEKRKLLSCTLQISAPVTLMQHAEHLGVPVL